MLKELHKEHIGMSRTKSLARSFVWWPTLNEAFEDLAKSCLVCQSHKHEPAVAPLHFWIWATSPRKRIHIDFASSFQKKMILILVDAHYNWSKVLKCQTLYYQQQ